MYFGSGKVPATKSGGFFKKIPSFSKFTKPFGKFPFSGKGFGKGFGKGGKFPFGI